MDIGKMNRLQVNNYDCAYNYRITRWQILRTCNNRINTHGDNFGNLW